MTSRKIGWLAVALLAAAIAGCGSANGNDSQNDNDSQDDTGGTLRVGIADAKPALPEGVQAVRLTVSEVSVSADMGDGGWVALPLAVSPYVVDLMQLQNGSSTELVPPTTLAPGVYHQLRLAIASGTIRIDGVDYPLDVPSDKVRTDKTFELTNEGAVDLTVDFDLSQSIVVTGNDQYKLKPVLHLVETLDAAEISGRIAPLTFGVETEASLVVYLDGDASGTLSAADSEYTRIVVPASGSLVDPTPFTVYWLAPDQPYVVQLAVGESVVYTEAIRADDLPPGYQYILHGYTPI